MELIKIRIWDKIANRYFCDQDQVLECLKQQATGIYDHNANGSIFEQFIGLKDKNGKEIYEGDIISIDCKNYPIIFEDACFLLKDYDNGDYYSGSDPLCTDYSKSKVIGNIHENKDLLEE